MSCILKGDTYWAINKLTGDESVTKRIYEVQGGELTFAQAKTIYKEMMERETPEVAKRRILRASHANTEGFIKPAAWIGLSNAVNRYNDVHDANLLKINKASNGSYYVTVDKAQEGKSRSAGRIKMTFVDPVTGTRDMRPTKENPENELLAEQFSEQISTLTNVFKANGVDVKVIVDGDLPNDVSGQLLGVNDPRYKALVASGQVTLGEAIILVNPRKLFADTVPHEFGHLFVDILGMDHPLVIRAIEELKTSPIWNEVANLYPELEGNDLAHEVLVTAMGRDAAELFQNPEKRNRIQRIFDLILEHVRKLFGTKKSTVRKLSKMMLRGEFKSSDRTTAAETRDRREVSPKDIVRTYVKSDSPVDVVYKKEITKLIALKENALRRRLSKTFSGSAAYTNTQAVIKDTETLKGLMLSLQFDKSVDKISFMVDAAQRYLDLYTSLDESSEKFLNTPRVLGAVDDQLTTYQEMLEHLDYAGNRLSDSIPEVEAQFEYLKNAGINIERLQKRILELRVKRDVMKMKWLRAQIKKHSPRDYAAARLREREKFIEANYDKFPDTAKLEEAAIAHANQYVQDNKADIGKLADDRIDSMMELGLFDINGLERIFMDPGAAADEIVQYVVKAIEMAEYNTRVGHIEFNKKIAAFEERMRALMGNGLNPDSKFDFMFEDTKKGKNFLLVSEYSSEPFFELESLKKIVHEAKVKDGANITAETILLEEKLDKYMKDNFDMTYNPESGELLTMTVKDKWKSKQYKALSKEQRELLDTVKTLIDETDKLKPFGMQLRKGFSKKTGGAGILDERRQSSKVKEGVSFYSIPSASKSFMQQLVSKPGQTISTAIEELRGKSAKDSVEYRDSVFEEVNEAGEFMDTVPLYFRGDIPEGRRSRNISNLLGLEYWNSSNFKNKSEMEPIISLLDEVLSERRMVKLDPITGKKVFSNLAGKVLRRTGEVIEEDFSTISGAESEVYKQFKRIVDDRLYGKHKVGSQVMHKFVDVMNSWVSKVNLSFNPFSATTQFTQGNLMNLMFSKHSKHMTTMDLLRAQAEFMTYGVASFAKDLGKINPTTYEGLLAQKMNIFQSYTPFSFDYNQTFRGQSAAGVTHALQTPVEMELSYTLAKTIMKGKKLIAKNGKFIKSIKGDTIEYTDKREEGLGFDRAYILKDGNLVKHPEVAHIDNQNAPFIVQERSLERLIHHIQRDAHGNFHSQNREEYKSIWYWRAIMNMRGWIPRGTNKRFRGIGNLFRGAYKDKSLTELIETGATPYDAILDEFPEGMYTSTIRFAKDLIKLYKKVGFMHFWGGFKGNTKKMYTLMTPEQQANIKASMMELSMFLGLITLAMVISASIDDDDEDAKMQMFSAFILSRTASEIGFYANPFETFRILRSPAASLSYGEKAAKLFTQFTEDAWYGEWEKYDRGIDKGKAKAAKYAEDVLPMLNAWNAHISEYYNLQTRGAFKREEK